MPRTNIRTKPAAAHPVAGDDPAIAAIGAHRRIWAKLLATHVPDEELQPDLYARWLRLAEREQSAADKVAGTVPTTIQGAAALAEWINEVAFFDTDANDDDLQERHLRLAIHTLQAYLDGACGSPSARVSSGTAPQRMTSNCHDCGTDTTPCTGKRGCRHKGLWEYYMVHNDVWRTAGMGKGFLCVGCLEARLGRTLTGKDFTDCPINEPDDWDTPRLAERRAARSSCSVPSGRVPATR